MDTQGTKCTILLNTNCNIKVFVYRNCTCYYSYHLFIDHILKKYRKLHMILAEKHGSRIHGRPWRHLNTWWYYTTITVETENYIKTLRILESASWENYWQCVRYVTTPSVFTLRSDGEYDVKNAHGIEKTETFASLYIV